jgi:hypothetical protein
MLKETPRNKGASGIMPITGNKRVPVMDGTPTLAEMGLDKKTSKLAQDGGRNYRRFQMGTTGRHTDPRRNGAGNWRNFPSKTCEKCLRICAFP